MARLVLGNIYSGRFLGKRGLLWRVIARARPRRLGSTLFRKRWAGGVLAVLPWERIVPFPPIVVAELTTRCNLKCPMCPRKAMSPKDALIEERLFRKIVDEVALHKGVLFIPGGRGEAMLHPRWEDYITYAKHSGISPVFVVTNATLLTQERATLLVDLGVEHIVPSIDGATKATYEAIRVGANFDQVVGNVRRLIELRRRAGTGRPQISLRFIRSPMTEHEMGAFVEYWNQYLSSHDEIKIAPLVRYLSSDDADRVISEADAAVYSAIRRHPGLMAPCTSLWKKLSIRYDGTMSVCCSRNLEASLLDANAYVDSLEDAWRSEQLRRVRRLDLLRRKLEHRVCRDCLVLGYEAQVRSTAGESGGADQGMIVQEECGVG